jgi:hypothetical protein
MEPCVSIQHSPQLLQLSAAVEQVLAADPRDVADSHRLGELEQMLTIHNQLDAAINQRLQVVDVDETTVAETGRATRSWLIEEQHINPSEATKRMRVARALPTHPAVDKASAAGEISLEHANAICRATAAVSPEFREIVESTLVDIARHCAPCDLGDEIEQLLIACGAESSSDEAHTKRLNRRGLRIARTFNGMRSVSGMLTPEVAAALEIALGVLSAKAGDDDARSHEQRQHDAVGELANHYLAHADLPAVNGERPRIVVTIDYDSLVTGLRDAWGQLPSGATISPATARRLACNAEVIPAVLNARGDVLDLGVPRGHSPPSYDAQPGSNNRADVRFPAAADHRRIATTSSGGRTGACPRSTMPRGCAPFTTGLFTRVAGRYAEIPTEASSSPALTGRSDEDLEIRSGLAHVSLSV